MTTTRMHMTGSKQRKAVDVDAARSSTSGSSRAEKSKRVIGLWLTPGMMRMRDSSCDAKIVLFMLMSRTLKAIVDGSPEAREVRPEHGGARVRRGGHLKRAPQEPQ
eukprot:882040-Rhodomonas_salina.3